MYGVLGAGGELPVPEGLQAEGKGPLAFLQRDLSPFCPLHLASGRGDRDGICILLSGIILSVCLPHRVSAQQLSAAVMNYSI